MPLYKKFGFAALALLAVTATAHARPVAMETLSGIAQKAEVLVVAEVTAIDQGMEGPSAQWGGPILQKRATLKILRGLKPADSSAVDMEKLTLTYSAMPATREMPPNGPVFPQLRVGQVALFPLKRVGETWQFVSEEDFAMVMPAAARTMNFDAPDARLLLFRELAGAFTFGDYETMARAGRYLDMLGMEKESPVEPVFALIRHEIGDANLREDPRWVQIAVAVYSAMPAEQRPMLMALTAGDLPTSKGLKLVAYCLRKSSSFQLEQRLLQALINHQEDPGQAAAIASTLAANFAENTSMLSLEREALKEGKAGALQVADVLIQSRVHPLAPTAAAAARAALVPEEGSSLSLDADTTRAAVSLLLRMGNEGDFRAFLGQVAQAAQDNAAAYPSYLRALVTSRSELPESRVLEVCRAYINDPTPVSPAMAGFADARLCDLAALVVSNASKENFAFSLTQPPAKRDQVVDQIQEYLRTRP